MKNLLPLFLIFVLCLGCDSPSKPVKKTPKEKKIAAKTVAEPDIPPEKQKTSEKRTDYAPETQEKYFTFLDETGETAKTADDSAEIAADWEKTAAKDPNSPFKKRQFGEELTRSAGDTFSQAHTGYRRITVDERRAANSGLKILRSKRLTLVTDMDLTPAVRALPKAADEAYPQLCEYFYRGDGGENDDWHLTAFLMKDNIPFMQAGYLPSILPSFKDGFSFNYDCWLYDQPSDYYRQHLLIHEMTHCFMLTKLGNVGPLWMTEGYAELFGMHDMNSSPVRLAFMPPSKEAVPYGARIRELRDETLAGRARTFREVLRMNYRDFQNNEVYIWSWSLMWFLKNHPDTEKVLHHLGANLTAGTSAEKVTDDFLAEIGAKLPEIEKHWMMYVATLDYRYCLAPMLFETSGASPIPSGERKIVTLRADRGWQNTGVTVKAGDVIRVRAQGRYELGNPGEKPWPCEPGGVTVRYYHGQPRGMVLAAICPDSPSVSDFRNRPADSFFAPKPVGLQEAWTVGMTGTLMLRINDAADLLERNSGTFQAEILRK